MEVDQKIKNEIEALNDEINGLDYYLKMLFISDAIVRQDDIDLNECQNLDAEGKLDLILSKFYEEVYYLIIIAKLPQN